MGEDAGSWRPHARGRDSIFLHTLECVIKLALLNQDAMLAFPVTFADLVRLYRECASDETLAAERSGDRPEHVCGVENPNRLGEVANPLWINGNTMTRPAIGDPLQGGIFHDARQQ